MTLNGERMPFHQTRNKDRHRTDATQLKVWLSKQLHAEFTSVCISQKMTVSSVLRGLLVAYILHAERIHD